MLKKMTSVVAVLLVAGATVVAADAKLDGVKCVVANRDANPEKSVSYKEGNVYFCCGGCQGKFEKNAKKYANKANLQLVATKQYEQKGCPFSGGKLNPDTAVTLAGTKVAFCCNNCKGKVDKAGDDAAKLKLVFNDKAFSKGFKKAEKK